ncbi:MAG: ubiquinone/menaquinone biosynthesis methyltransferase [Thermodesulfobacteriota bacterium]
MKGPSPENGRGFSKDPASVRDMFSRIAPRYDLMNRLMTLGQDRVWREKLLQRADIPETAAVLDLGAGTGDLALAVARMRPRAAVTAADFTWAMLARARNRPGAGKIGWAAADALALPFADASFDVVVSGYLLRNVPDLDRAFAEQLRVLKPGGRMACLDTAPPSGPAAVAVLPVLRFLIPALGGLVAGDRAAYSYLPETTRGFLSARDLAGRMKAAGFADVAYRSFLFSTQTAVVGRKP